MHIPYVSKKIDKDWLAKIAEETEYTSDAPELARCDRHNLFVIDDLQRGRKYHNILSSGGSTLVATAFTEAQFHCWKRMPDPPEIPTQENDDQHGTISIPEEVFTTRGKERVFLGFAYTMSLPKKKREPLPTPPICVSAPLIIALPKKDQLTTTEWVEDNRSRNRYDHWAKIIGELWSVPANHFYSLDKFMENGKVFKRRRVALEMPLRKTYNDGHVERITRSDEAYMYIGIPEFWEPQIDGGYLFQPMTISSRSSLNRKYYCYTKLED